MSMDVKPDAPRRGRPRNPDADELIRAATLRLLSEYGYDRCSIDAVADEAGVTRATVYRRYPTKVDLVTESVCAMQTLPDPAQITDCRACLVWLMEQFSEGVGQADGVSIVSSLYVQRREHPDMLERFRAAGHHARPREVPDCPPGGRRARPDQGRMPTSSSRSTR